MLPRRLAFNTRGLGCFSEGVESALPDSGGSSRLDFPLAEVPGVFWLLASPKVADEGLGTPMQAAFQ